MKPSITFVAAAILLAGAFTARAQNSELGVPTVEAPSTKAPATRRSAPNHRTRTKAETEQVPVTTDPETSLPRLPSVFRNCEEPTPRYCRFLP